MVWIRTDDSLPDERMTRRLAALLKIPVAFAVGLIIRLRLFTIRFDPDGYVSDCGEAEIREAVGWPTDAAPILPAFVESGVIIRHGGRQITLKLYDWERCIQGYKKNERDRTRPPPALGQREERDQIALTPTVPHQEAEKGGTRPPPVSPSAGEGPAPDGSEGSVLRLLDEAGCPTKRETQRRYVRAWIASHGIEYVGWALTQPAAKGRDVVQLAREFFDEKKKPPPKPPEPPCEKCQSRRWVYVKDPRDPAGVQECLASCPTCRPNKPEGTCST